MNDLPKNIEAFNWVCLKLLAELYDAFPCPKNIEAGDAVKIGFAALPPEASEDHELVALSCHHVITWLSEEGFLRYEPDPNGRQHFWKVRLTMKGLTILGSAPSALQDPGQTETLVARAKRLLALGAGAAASEAVKQVVSAVFKQALSPDSATVGKIHV